MQIDLAHLFSASYLFNFTPTPLLPVFFKILLSFFAALVILGFISRKLGHKNTYAPIKKFFNKLANFLTTLGVLGLLYVFFREQNVYFLSAPFWLLVWFLAALIWLGFLLRYYFTDRPERLEQIKQETDKKKYLKR